MSIVALKRKTAAKYNNNSVGQAQFSIVGTHRSQGFIGQSTQSRSLTRTLMRGNTARGSGGCCGMYPKAIITSSEICTTEDSNVVKISSKGNLGMLMTKHRWVRRPYPFSDTKTVATGTVSQSDYIERTKKISMQDVAECGSDITVSYSICDPTKAGIKNCTISYEPVLNKHQYLSQTEYLEKLNQSCAELYTAPSVSIQREPYSGM